MKLKSDPALAALLPNAIESLPSVEEALTKKAEGRPITPEEYTMLGQFVDRVERRTLQIREEAVRAESGLAVAAIPAGAHPDVPTAAFGMPLDQIGLKEHVFNILVEAGYDNLGALMVALKVDADKVLKLPGIGPKAMQNIEESLATVTFPEPEPTPPAEPEPVPAELATTASLGQAQATDAPAAEAEPVPAAVALVPAEAAPVAEAVVAEKPALPKKEPKKHGEEPEDDVHKDGVSLDELFSMKPEIFQAGAATEEESADKKKGKKTKKKSVELEFDEERGEVVARKKHKRGDDVFGEDE
jgi:N utilization substance protein A